MAGVGRPPNPETLAGLRARIDALENADKEAGPVGNRVLSRGEYVATIHQGFAARGSQFVPDVEHLSLNDQAGAMYDAYVCQSQPTNDEPIRVARDRFESENRAHKRTEAELREQLAQANKTIDMLKQKLMHSGLKVPQAAGKGPSYD